MDQELILMLKFKLN